MLSTTAAAQTVEPARPKAVEEKQVSAGLGLAVASERTLTVLVAGQVSYRVHPGYWLHAAAGIGGAGPSDPAGTGYVGGRAYEGRAGLGRWKCGGGACVGLLGGLGYQHQSIDFDDALTQPMPWTETRELGFAELRVAVRFRLFNGPVGLEAGFGVRANVALQTEGTSGDTTYGWVGGLGLHVEL
jgi:hypothetical protein